jgi:hypothetical protein
MSLLPRSGCTIVCWRTWLSYAWWHDPSDPWPWLGAQGTTSQPRAMSFQATRCPRVPFSISSIVTCERCHELQLRMAVSLTCKPQFHTYRVWETNWCSEALTFLSPQTSPCLSSVTLSSTHEFQLWTPMVNASCLHKSLGVILRHSNYLGYGKRLLQLLPWCWVWI